MQRNLILAITTTGIAVALFACSGDSADKRAAKGNSDSGNVSNVNAEVAIDPTAVTFVAQDIDGRLRESTEWLGKQPLVINFWGTWCSPCRREIPEFVRLYDEYKDKGVEIISFALNDSPERVRSYAERNDMEWVLLLGDYKIAMDYGGIMSVPTTIFLDRSGRELKRFVGPRSYEVFKREFDRILEST